MYMSVHAIVWCHLGAGVYNGRLSSAKVANLIRNNIGGAISRFTVTPRTGPDNMVNGIFRGRRSQPLCRESPATEDYPRVSSSRSQK